MNADELRELLADKSAMESLKYEDLLITRSGELGPEIDRLCAQNAPGLFRQRARQFKIPSAAQILASLADHEVEVAVTPEGNADSPVNGMFAQPHTAQQTLGQLVSHLEDRIGGRAASDGRHYYFQSQNDNLEELSALAGIPRSLDCGTQLLGPQTAANLWVGTSGTTSRLHNDNFDNIYVQLQGHKRIYLIPPGSVADVAERRLRLATYDSDMRLVPCGDDVPEDFRTLLFPTYNPATEPRRGWQFVVDLHAGDVLFLPALWYHQIEIVSNEINVSLNYWHKPFDDELRWAQWNFTRQIANRTCSSPDGSSPE